MKESAAEFEIARRKVLDFMHHYQASWSDFVLLQQLDSRFAGLDRKHWARVIRGETEPKWKKCQLTILFAAALEHRLDEIVQLMPSCRSRPRLASQPVKKPATRPSLSDAEELTLRMLRCAGEGCITPAFDLLVARTGQKATHSPEEAAIFLRGAIYLSNRYLHPDKLLAAVSQTVLPRFRSVGRPLRIEPAARGTVLAQLAYYLMDHGSGRIARALYHDADVSNLRSSSRVPDHLWAQMLRNYAWLRATVDARPREALSCVKDARQVKSEENLRSAAISECNLFRLEGKLGEAWRAIQPFYEKSSQVLRGAAQDHRIDPGNLVHHFVCLFIGAICRSGAAELYNPDERSEDIQAMQWITSQTPYLRIENVQFSASLPRCELPQKLETFRRTCIASALSAEHVNAIRDLQAFL